jgi:hypothetical protein
MQPRDGLVPKKGADALDRAEILPVPHGPDAPAVHEGLVDREVEPVGRSLHARAVERALPAADRDPAAARTAEGVAVDTVLEEQELDPRV